MAPFIRVPETLQVEFRYTFGTRQMENVLNFFQNDGWNIQNAATFLQFLQTWWADNMAPITSSSIRLSELYATDLSAQDSFTVGITPTGGIPGQTPAEMVPPQNALVLTLRTAQRGRSYRGRMYMVGIAEQDQSNGQASPGLVQGLQEAGQTLLADSNTLDAPWVVVSRRLNKQPRPFGVPTPITSVIVRDAAIDTMRSRAS